MSSVCVKTLYFSKVSSVCLPFGMLVPLAVFMIIIAVLPIDKKLFLDQGCQTLLDRYVCCIE